ncbi:hypothetical protein [Floridanema aerugineum]|uniref:Uncharacterized protein n=1 Tax=Floridaenema aerugineum BLCC-F46 TaxID=3153654 RepID=A0ABV4XAP8_9CYAN
MFKTIYFTTTCMAIGLTVFAPNQSAQAIPQLTSPENVTRSRDKFPVVYQFNYDNCPTNSPRSCVPGGSR